MKTAIVVTATRGLGIRLAELSAEFNISSSTYAITKPGVGESTFLPAASTNRIINIDDDSDLNIVLNKPADYIVWYSGVFLQKAFDKTSDYEIDTLIDLHLTYPLKLLRNIHKQQKQPYHLIVAASCSSWRIRHNEALYCGLCAAKATFTRNFANDLNQQLPGSKVLLINPGGLRTPFFYEKKEVDNIHEYLDEESLAKFIWERAVNQKDIFSEIQFLRPKSKMVRIPIIEYCSKTPETI